MKEVYASWPTAIITVLVLLIAGAVVWLEAPGTLTAYITLLLLGVVGLWVILSAMGKFPLYKLR